MARKIRLITKTGQTVTTDLYLDGTTVSAETVSYTEVAPQIYEGTVTAAAGSYLLNLKFSGSLVGDDRCIVGATDATTYPADSVVPNLSGSSIGSVVSGAGATAAEVWAYATRTITMTAAQIAAAIEGTTITIHRGDTVTISITGLGSLASRTGEKLWFTVKHRDSDSDAKAVIQVGETTGAIRLNGEAATPSHASLVVTDQATGAITITLKPALTSQLRDGQLSYDIQILETAIVRTLTLGTATVTADITRAIA